MLEKIGRPCGTRTHDTLIKSQVLKSLQKRFSFDNIATNLWKHFSCLGDITIGVDLVVQAKFWENPLRRKSYVPHLAKTLSDKIYWFSIWNKVLHRTTQSLIQLRIGYSFYRSDCVEIELRVHGVGNQGWRKFLPMPLQIREMQFQTLVPLKEKWEQDIRKKMLECGIK